MSRGRDTEAEQSRIARDEVSSSRAPGKRGSGAVHFEKKGFGSETGMQRNTSKGMPADKKGI